MLGFAGLHRQQALASLPVRMAFLSPRPRKIRWCVHLMNLPWPRQFSDRDYHRSAKWRVSDSTEQ
jgi:hypothetical protein